MMEKPKRILYFDSLKFFAVMWIFLNHFIEGFHDEYFVYWNSGISEFFLGGLGGKAAVALLAVILGYFAYAKASRGGKTIDMVIQRYIFFFIMGLVINLIYYICGHWNYIDHHYTIQEVMLASLNIDDSIFPTFWCIKAFFIGSVISYINGKFGVSYFEILAEIIILYYFDAKWVAVCLMGNYVYLIIKKEETRHHAFFKNVWGGLLAFAIAFGCIKMAHLGLFYRVFFYGAASAFLLGAIGTHQLPQRIIGNRFCALLGRNCMGIYILHPITKHFVGEYMFSVLGGMSYNAAFVISFFVTAVVVCILAIAAEFIIRKVSTLLSTGIIWLKDQIVPKDKEAAK